MEKNKNQIDIKKLISLGELFKKTWELFKKGFWKLLAIYGIGCSINFGLILLLGLIVLICVLLGIIQIDTAGLQEKLSPPGGLAPALLQSSTLAVWGTARFLSRFTLPLVLGLSIFLGIMISGYWISASSFVLISGISRNMGIKESLKQAWKKTRFFCLGKSFRGSGCVPWISAFDCAGHNIYDLVYVCALCFYL